MPRQNFLSVTMDNIDYTYVIGYVLSQACGVTPPAKDRDPAIEMCSDRIFDVTVVGAGVEGSATAYYLSSRYTINVLLLEQVSLLYQYYTCIIIQEKIQNPSIVSMIIFIAFSL